MYEIAPWFLILIMFGDSDTIQVVPMETKVLCEAAATKIKELSEIPALFKAQTDRIVQAIDKARKDVANLQTNPAITRAA